MAPERRTHRDRRLRWRAALGALAVCLATSAGCDTGRGRREVVVYTALDRGFSEPIFALFTRQTGIEVLPLFDTESTKTVGLAQRVRAERARPRCDVFWNNEIIHTLRLEREGLLSPSAPRAASRFPSRYRDAEGHWHGFAARARVLIVNRELVPDGEFPASVEDLAAPDWKGKTAIAKPLFGTTATHIACLLATRGAGSTTALLERLRANEIQIHGGNKGVAVAVAAGRAAFGLTDTDDAVGELEKGAPVRIVYPDQAAGMPGTLFLPNTVALIAGSPHPEAGRELIEFLLSPEVEALLARGPSAQIPLGAGVDVPARVQGPGQCRVFVVDFEDAGRQFDASRRIVEERFLK